VRPVRDDAGGGGDEHGDGGQVEPSSAGMPAGVFGREHRRGAGSDGGQAGRDMCADQDR
jgi:hypothetical protein